jgi:hypothetical protein
MRSHGKKISPSARTGKPTASGPRPAASRFAARAPPCVGADRSPLSRAGTAPWGYELTHRALEPDRRLILADPKGIEPAVALAREIGDAPAPGDGSLHEPHGAEPEHAPRGGPARGEPPEHHRPAAPDAEALVPHPGHDGLEGPPPTEQCLMTSPPVFLSFHSQLLPMS